MTAKEKEERGRKWQNNGCSLERLDCGRSEKEEEAVKNKRRWPERRGREGAGLRFGGLGVGAMPVTPFRVAW